MTHHACQSCGMPMYSCDILGTGPDGRQMEDYCIYCYKDGGFTSDVTMDEMMRLCTNYVDGNKRDYYIAGMRTLYPHLKRWAKKEDTQSEYYRSINRVLDYVKGHLHENTDLKTLAGIACISPYHFHRIFKSVIGESIAEYVGRLRMEYVAGQLRESALSLSELADRTGYSSEQSLSRAFKKYFNLPPKVFRTMHYREAFGDELKPRICKVGHRNIVMLREKSDDGWKRLYVYAMVNGLLCDATESIEVIRKDNYTPAISTAELQKPGRHSKPAVLGEGLYAIFTHRGDPAGIARLYTAINNYWLRSGKYDKGEGMPYVVYLNHASQTAPGDLLAEIYVPVAAN